MSQVGIFEPIGESLVEAADPSKVPRKGRRVTPSPARLAGNSSVHDGTHKWKMTDQQPSALVDVSPPETRAIQVTGHHLVYSETIREGAAEKHSSAGQITPFPSGPHVSGQALGWGDAVPVEEDQIVAPSFPDREIENGSFSDALVRMPYMADRNWGSCGIVCDGSACFWSTPIIRNDQLKLTERLSEKTREHQPQAVEVVVGGYNH